MLDVCSAKSKTMFYFPIGKISLLLYVGSYLYGSSLAQQQQDCRIVFTTSMDTIVIGLFIVFQSLSHVQHFCNPMDCRPAGCALHGFSQARTLEWIAFPSPGDLPDPGIEPTSPALAGRFLTIQQPGKPRNKIRVIEC